MPTATETQHDTQLVRLDKSALVEAKTILYHAYRDEPTFQYLFDHHRPGYEQRVRATLREGLELHFASGQDALGVLVDGRLAAVAFISTEDARSGLSHQFNWRIRMMLTAGLACTRRYMDYHEQILKLLPEGLCHYLPFVGVDPDYQRHGLGRRLMEAVEHICRESPVSSGIALDTGNARYIRFYTSMGYKPCGEIELGPVREVVLFKSLVSE